MLPNIVYLAAVISAGGVTTAMALHLWLNRRIVAPDLSLALVACLWLWITAQIGECVFADIAVKIIFYKVKFTAISLVSVSLLGFCLRYTRGNVPSRRPLLLMVSLPLLLFNVLSFAPAFEALSWKRFFLSPNRLLLDIEPLIGYVAYNVYHYLIIAAGYTLLVTAALAREGAAKRRVIPFLLAALFSSSAGLADFFLKKQIFYYRLLPIAIALSSLVFIYYLRLRYSRAIPLAQHVLSESMADGLVILSPHDDIIYVNPSARALFSDVTGRPLTALPSGLTRFVESVDGAQAHNGTIRFSGRSFGASLSPLHNRRGRPAGKVIVLRDITYLVKIEEDLRDLTSELEKKVAERTLELEEINRTLQEEVEERKRAEERLQSSLEEKNVLLGELHHRVKNNLQIVSSLLRLQSLPITDPDTRRIFDTFISRVRSMALAHERLYKSEDLAHTHFGEYLNELVHSVVAGHSGNGDSISVALEVDPVSLDIDKSILGGLIVNELVLNSLKHAFKQGGETSAPGRHEIVVGFKVGGEDYVLTYRDNGPGLPAGFDVETTSSLGLKIVMTLVRQMRGTLEVLPGPGFNTRIRFPVRRE